MNIANSKKNSSPLPMQYLGSKSRISPWIVESIKKNLPPSKVFLDLFAGTGIVSLEAQSRGFTPYLNDIQPYSAIVLKSIFVEKRKGIPQLILYLESKEFQSRLFKAGRNGLKNFRNLENNFFEQNKKGQLDWHKYKIFCEKTPSQWTRSEILNLKKSNSWNLFSCYYANKYFGIQQALELDLIRQVAEEQNSNLKTHLISAAISAMSMCVSSTTHLAQYLKPSSKKNAKNLINKRQTSILNYVIANLKQLQQFKPAKKSIVTNLNFVEAINFYGETTKNCIIYADPPYFKEHYSRYYHVLDTFLLYDYPYLSWNTQRNSVTTGLYRENRIVSEFGLKSKVTKAFENLFQNAKRFHFSVALSYANTSLVRKETLIRIAEQFDFKVKVLSQELMHSGQGQKRNKSVTEYLFLCKTK